MPTGEMLRRHFRALAAAHPRGAYVDFWDAWQNNGGAVTGGIGDNWAGFGSKAAKGWVWTSATGGGRVPDTDPANTLGPSVADPAVDPGPLPTLPWMVGTPPGGNFSVEVPVRGVAPTTNTYLVSGCFRFDRLIGTNTGGSSGHPAVIAATGGSGGGTVRTDTKNPPVGLFMTSSHGTTDHRGKFFPSNGPGAINDFRWVSLTGIAGTPELDIGESAVFIVDSWRFAWRKVGDTTWTEYPATTPGAPGQPGTNTTYLKVGSTSSIPRGRTTCSVACGLSLWDVEQSTFDRVKDLWDTWGP